MGYRYRDPLAQTRREHFLERMQHQRETMTKDQVRGAMVKIIKDKLAIREPVTDDDFRLANLPMDLVRVIRREMGR